MANLWLDLKGPILADTVYIGGTLVAKDVTIALPANGEEALQLTPNTIRPARLCSRVSNAVQQTAQTSPNIRGHKVMPAPSRMAGPSSRKQKATNSGRV